MNIAQFIKLHKVLSISIPKSVEFNPIASDTDPTLDVPVRNITIDALGNPTNVKQTTPVFNNIKSDEFTSIERRNTDKFDVLGELQDAAKSVSMPDITTNYKPQKQQKQHDEI